MMLGGGAIGNEAQPSESHILLGWGFVLVVTVGVFVGTLLLRPKQSREAA